MAEIVLQESDLADLFFGLKVDGIETINAGGWEQEGKWQYKHIIVKIGDKYYEFSASRCGSYHTDWEYDFDTTGHEVKEVQQTVSYWVKA